MGYATKKIEIYIKKSNKSLLQPVDEIIKWLDISLQWEGFGIQGRHGGFGHWQNGASCIDLGRKCTRMKGKEQGPGRLDSIELIHRWAGPTNRKQCIGMGTWHWLAGWLHCGCGELLQMKQISVEYGKWCWNNESWRQKYSRELGG